MKQKKGICSKCHREGATEPHHPFPRRWFGKGAGNDFTVELCLACHVIADKLTIAFDKSIMSQHSTGFREIFVEFMRETK